MKIERKFALTQEEQTAFRLVERILIEVCEGSCCETCILKDLCVENNSPHDFIDSTFQAIMEKKDEFKVF